MLVFIDESGDPGFKVAKGSSPLFAAAMVVFDNPAEADRTQEIIRKLLGRIHRRPEFKFNKCRNEVRDTFFEAVRGQGFVVRAIVVRKDLIWSEQLRTDDESFYRFFIKSMVKFDNQTLSRAKVIIDGSGDRAFRRSLTAYLKRHAARDAIDEVKIRDSRSEPLLQLADMCAGAIARSYRADRARTDRWRSMIAKKIDDIWEFK
jgi:Protein of unknown function (DUF3800)